MAEDGAIRGSKDTAIVRISKIDVSRRTKTTMVESFRTENTRRNRGK